MIKSKVYARHVRTNPFAFGLDVGVSTLHTLQGPDFWGDRGRAVGCCAHDKGDDHGSGTRNTTLTTLTDMRVGEKR